jgi:hypothetical protein
VVTGLLLLAALAGCADPVPGADAGPARDTVVYSATPEDASIIRAKVVWGREEGLDTLAVGEAMASLGLTFLGTPYRPGTLEAPGEERVVVNLRELDCVTFVETVAALTELIRDPSVDPEADAARLEARFARALEARRYRGGELDGYPSRLHYFSEWIRDNHERGRVHDLTAELGGDAYPGPVDFMSTHPEAYRQLADPDVLTAVVAMEARESARPRFRIPEDRIQGVEAGIQAGDIIAATSAIEGLDVAHTGIAVRVNGRVHLLHAPLVGEEVQLSAVPLADRIKGIPGQDGIMVARPLDGAGVTRGNGSEPGGTARPTGQED